MDGNKVIFIIGLPGSGKTHLANELKEKYGKALILDDPTKEQIDNLFNIEIVDTNIIITDCKLCDEELLIKAIRMFLINGYNKFEFFFFKNEPEKCRMNDIRRGREKLSTKLIYELSNCYFPPLNAIDVYLK
jgi:adenylate kinase family enzyme